MKNGSAYQINTCMCGTVSQVKSSGYFLLGLIAKSKIYDPKTLSSQWCMCSYLTGSGLNLWVLICGFKLLVNLELVFE